MNWPEVNYAPAEFSHFKELRSFLGNHISRLCQCFSPARGRKNQHFNQCYAQLFTVRPVFYPVWDEGGELLMNLHANRLRARWESSGACEYPHVRAQHMVCISWAFRAHAWWTFTGFPLPLRQTFCLPPRTPAVFQIWSGLFFLAHHNVSATGVNHWKMLDDCSSFHN